MAVTLRALNRLARSVTALVALTALLGGVPWALSRFVGWPLPRVIPSWSEVSEALKGASISDDVLIKSLASVTWVAWAVLASCFVAEGRAWLRGREARDLPLAGLVQPIVRELVVSATLLFGSLRPAGQAYATPRSTPVVMLTAGEAVAAAALAAAATPGPRAETQLPTCVVVPRDSLWKLAENHLGDGIRWRDIWELNQDRTFPDGRRFIDASLINPGWVLSMPADATGLSALTNGRPETVPPPDLPPRAAAPAVAPIPSAAAEPESPTTPPMTTLAPSNGLDAPATGDNPAIVADPADDPDFAVAPILAGSALVAAGVIASLSRLRRRQLRNRVAGRMIRLPEPEAAHAEVHLRRASVDAPFDRLDLALRVLAHCLAQREAGPCPVITAVSAGPAAIEILLTETVTAPAGRFDVAADGQAWSLPTEVLDSDLRPIADTRGGPAPALVTVGTIDERSVLVDLEAGSRTLLGGDPADAERLLWTMAVDIATSNRADDVNLLLVGQPPTGLDSLDRVRTVADLDAVIDEIEAEAAAVTASLAERRCSTTFAARIADPSDTLTPTVVLVVARAEEPALDRLLKAAEEYHGLAVVVAGEIDGDFDRELCVEGETLIVKPVGLRLSPASLPADVLAATGELFATAVDLSPGDQLNLGFRSAVRPRSEALTIGPNELPLTFDENNAPVVPPGHVLVRVLGAVEVVGGNQPIDRRRSIELFVYLALHPEGVDDVRLRTVLWPDSAPTQAAFNETVSRARRLVGLDPEGKHHLFLVDNGRYRVGPYVATDAALLESLASGGDSQDVLRLVRGLPFESTHRGYEWAHAEGQAHRLSALLDEFRHER